MSFGDMTILPQRCDANWMARDLMDENAAAEDCMVPSLNPTSGLGADFASLAEARLAERTRIAQELHDTLFQGFLAASLQLHAVAGRLSVESPEKQRISDVIELVQRTLKDGRNTLHELRCPESQISSLGAAFASVPKDLGYSNATGFRVVVLGKEKALRTGLLTEVYYIGREAIINACRHSQANEIEAEIEYRYSDLRIAVRDNGRGIGPEDLQLAGSGHWGLHGMRERAERIGARLRLWSSAALGTEVELCLPGALAFERGESQKSF
jgi:signal transduction histidine kinase